MRAKALLARGLDRLAELAVARPRTVLALALAGLALAAWSGSRLGLKTSNLDLIDPDHPEVRAFRELARELGTPNTLIVVLESEDPNALRPAADRLLPRLAQGPGVKSVLGRLPVRPRALAGGFGLAPALDPYFTSRDGGLLFVLVQPDDPESRAATLEPFVRGVRAAIADSGVELQGVRLGLTGLPQYALDDREVIAHDISRLSGLSFLLVLGLFTAAFASFLRPLLVMLCLAGATVVLLGVAAVWPGHLTLLSSFFGSIVFGMGVDFGILILDRFEEGLADSAEAGPAILGAIRALSPGLATGGLTTAMGFFTMMATGFRGFAELGWLAGLGIVSSLLTMVTLLPALLVLVPRRRKKERRLVERRIGRVLLSLQRPGLAAALVLAGLVSIFVPGPGFNSDYLSLEPRGSEAVRLEREMVRRSDFSPQFAAFLTPSAEAARDLAARLAREQTVGAVHSGAELDLLAATGALDPAAAGAFRERFVSPSGRHAVYAYPKGDVWDPAFRDRFLTRMREIDPGATGMPFLGRTMIELSRRALAIAGGLAVLILLACVWADLRDLRLALLALMPIALGLGLMRLAMSALGISFNPLNLMALPVVIGVGEDNAVHLLHRLLEEGGDLGRALAGTGRSLVLTSGTTAASFVALSFASHQGLASFAQALALGVASTLAMTLLVLPQAATRLLPRLALAPARRTA